MKDTLRITVEYLYDTDLDLEVRVNKFVDKKKKLLSIQNGLKVRTAALYTIYAIYFHQINRPRLKVFIILC